MARARLKRIVLLSLPRPSDEYSERADKPDTLTRIGAVVEVIHRQIRPLASSTSNTRYRRNGTTRGYGDNLARAMVASCVGASGGTKLDAIEQDTTTHVIADIETEKHAAIDASLFGSHPALYRLAHPYTCWVCEVDCCTREKLEEHRERVGCSFQV